MGRFCAVTLVLLAAGCLSGRTIREAPLARAASRAGSAARVAGRLSARAVPEALGLAPLAAPLAEAGEVTPGPAPAPAPGPTPEAGPAPQAAPEDSTLILTRAGSFSLRGGLGFTAGPDTFLLGLETDSFVTDALALGPSLEFGVADERVLVAPTAHARYVFDLPGPLERLKPSLKAGLGLGYLHKNRRRGDDDDVGFLLNVGGGADYEITSDLILGSHMLFNIFPDEVIDENFYFSWQVVTFAFRF